MKLQKVRSSFPADAISEMRLHLYLVCMYIVYDANNLLGEGHFSIKKAP